MHPGRKIFPLQKWWHFPQNRKGPANAGPQFDNPKTNLTYEKNLYILYFKYRAKLFTNIEQIFFIKKCFCSPGWILTIV